MKIRYFLTSVLLCFVLITNAQVKYKTAPSGLKYFMFTNNKGDKPKIGDVLKFHFILKTDKDSILLSSYKSGNPPETRLTKPSYPGDLMDGFALMSKGDSSIFLVSADSFYGPQNMPVKSGSMLAITIKLLDVTPGAVFEEKNEKNKRRTSKSGPGK